MTNKIRRPVVSGQFYEGNENSLNESIKQCFLDERGPMELPKFGKGNKKIYGVIVPHAGYVFSGAIAAYSYHILAKNGFSDTFIILGPNHTGIGSGVSVMTEGSWETPLGNIPINNELANLIWKDIIDKDEKAHLHEHSIEVQLPFLQYIAGDKKFNFVPISMAMQDIETSIEVGNIIADAIRKTKSKSVIIASSDFSHIGFNYMSMAPPGKGVDEYAKEQDELAIKKILKLNPSGLTDIVNEKKISMCGYGPIAAMLTASKKIGATKSELLKYGTSYEVQPGSSCVGYAAIAVY